MCHILENTGSGTAPSMSMSRSGTQTSSIRGIYSLRQTQTKNAFRLNPFRKVAKSARINLNKYWGLLSTKLQTTKPLTTESSVSYDEEMEQNRVNELLEAQANASSQNSLNTQFEEDYFYYNSQGYPLLYQHSPSGSPQPLRRFVRQPQRSLGSSRSSCTSPTSQQYYSFDDSTSQDSVFL